MPADVLLIEDAASGAQLIQTLRHDELSDVPRPIAIKPEADKITRFSGQTAKIEAGCLFLTRDASWLARFEHEVLGFPNARHDDQVDALSQLLAWQRKRREPPVLGLAYEPDYSRTPPWRVGWES
ncbi:phage terminase large subunit [Limibaculum sp. FT325]|uniref:phage terminase large subunit n=1 Tax=Thermohalobaculum sediminis TaxID=2939436 RepID=UPI0020BF5E10|nr:phage terminase large subunit [Limibaculum sediminis]MCL5778863.1 phage terminase large subunit [Limibaculum sediminis]